MATTIITKHSATAKDPQPSQLERGELAIDLERKNIYTKDASDAVVQLAESQWKDNGNDIYYDDGNVGIGTDNPISQSGFGSPLLEVSGSSGGSILSTNSTTGLEATFTAFSTGINIAASGSADASTGNNIVFRTGDVNSNYNSYERMRIDANGNVRIGYNPASGPFAKLDIFGSGSQNIYMITTDGTATPNNIVSHYGSGADYSDLNFRGRQFRFDAGLALYPASGPVVIDASGNVGIGTDNPESTLTVKPQSSAVGTHENQCWLYSTESGDEFDLKLKQVVASNIVKYTFDLRNSGTSYNNNLVLDRGRVGIGGDPGTRTAGEYLEQAKTQLEGWKAEVKKRTAEQPEASTQEITLEVTDGDFGVMPPAEALAEKMAERAIGGGDAKLQVAGDGYFTGTVEAAQFTRNGNPVPTTLDLIETLATLRNATKDEDTLEGLRDALGDAIGGLIQKFEAIQA